MKLGERLTLDGTLTEENLAYLKQLGINSIMIGVAAAAGQPERQPVKSNLRLGAYLELQDRG